MKKAHTFHVPVMGTGFTVDSPIKVAKYGISSVISLVDDTLIEEIRKYYCEKEGEEYTPITKHDEDCRARRITAYLDLVDKIVKKQFEEVKASAFEPGTEITKYFELLPDESPLKEKYQETLIMTDAAKKSEMQDKLRDEMEIGSIDVNIMTKLDRPNYAVKDGSPLPVEFSDALAALRGYAESQLKSAIVFSAGLNQRLYNYVSEFTDFYTDATGFIKKKIILKVSDYRSSLIQGKIFAKKGLWVSEYRVESGLNCGGHAFATNGNLMGPILEEFKHKRQELIDSLHSIYSKALELKKKISMPQAHDVVVTAQGGIGTANEDKFLRSCYKVDATGWGSPFLLCPEAATLDKKTAEHLARAGEKDFYPSDSSPLGVIFNNLRQSLSEVQKHFRAQTKPGSACFKGHLSSDTEFTEKPICPASRQYQKLKLNQLAAQGLDENEYKIHYNKIIEKACICHELGDGARIEYGIIDQDKGFPAVCPGPNLAYFSRIVTLKEMVDHIYGRINILNDIPRPHMFLKELDLYVDHFMKEFKEASSSLTEKQLSRFANFTENLVDGINYYQKLFPKMQIESEEYRKKMLEELESLRNQFENFVKANLAPLVPELKILPA
ncbi:MAG: hypothetical protein KAJ18_06135 [Candidatus Omnitrophica bacterium]|nr:hypothetical protein [Candidatus Omnitrophota bacterium]